MTRPTAPRVRFAPSPTGSLHIGGARTVLFNWLHARQKGGSFILRIEDTDQARSTQASASNIIEALRWLGLDWDEGPEAGGPYGPYSQMERLPTYREHADRLVEEGKAYRCYTTKAELEALRNDLPPEMRNRFVYPRIWRDRSRAEWPADGPYVIRFKTPLDGNTTFVDHVFGKITTPNTQIQDFVLMRSDGVPLYNFGAVVDDVLMKITLVARGADHIINTPQQILLYEALGYPIPEMAHLPMILGPHGRKMGKRDGEKYGIPVSVMQYRELGYAPLGVLNYLSRFGWSHGDQELFTMSELVEHFSFDNVQTADGAFDMKKCQAINQKILQSDTYTPFAEYVERVRPFVEARGLKIADEGHFRRVVALARTRAATLVECAQGVDYFLRDEPELDPKAAAKFLKPDNATMLRELSAVLEPLDPFVEANIGSAIQEYARAHDADLGQVAQPVRVALSGRTNTPGLYEIIELLGKEATLRRLEAGAQHAERSTQ